MPTATRGWRLALRLLSYLAAGGLLLFTTACASTRASAPAGPAIEVLWAEYERAVDDARYPRPERISRDLVAITAAFPDLVWDGTRQRVLMVAWTDGSRFAPGESKLSRPTWLTAVPFLERFCQASGLRGTALETRLDQRLGLPPQGSVHDTFVEMWIDPADLFRACPDPEINDHECLVNLTAGDVDRGGSCPWSAALKQQVSGRFVSVARGHLDWMCQTWASSYPPGQPRRSFPWTALGYTYDWSPASRNHIGDSEFVAPAGTAVAVRRAVPTAQYCRPDQR